MTVLEKSNNDFPFNRNLVVAKMSKSEIGFGIFHFYESKMYL
jgi:hypothetical protein